MYVFFGDSARQKLMLMAICMIGCFETGKIVIYRKKNLAGTVYVCHLLRFVWKAAMVAIFFAEALLLR